MPKTLNAEPLTGEAIENWKRLLKEYVARIEKIGDQALELRRAAIAYIPIPSFGDPSNWIRSEIKTLNDAFARVRPLAEELDRHASQLIEYARVDDLDRSELQLRLAEIESAILITERRLSGAIPKF
jgi:hypothetical protein